MHATTLITNATVFDGTSFLPQQSLLFNSEEILAVGVEIDTPSGCEVIDGRGQTVLPGLIDAHVHIPSNPEFAERNLRYAVSFGVTTVIDLGAEPAVIKTMKAMARHSSELADLISAGVLATPPGGHPLELGGDLPTLQRPEEAAGFVAARVAEGSDVFKIDSGKTLVSRPGWNRLSWSVLRNTYRFSIGRARRSILVCKQSAPIMPLAGQFWRVQMPRILAPCLGPASIENSSCCVRLVCRLPQR